MFKWILMILVSFTLAACAKPPKSTYPPAYSTETNTMIALANSAKSVSHSLNELNATEQAAYPPLKIAEPPSPAAYGMNIPASLNWQGPLEPVVAQIAKASNFKFKTLGHKPSVPILISINEENSNLGDILRNVSMQAKKRADVVVYPDSRTIEIRYTESG